MSVIRSSELGEARMESPLFIVRIGDGAVVGSRSVVVKDVQPYTIVAGNPARVIRKRFDEDTISRLLYLKWWQWSDDKIEAFLPMLLSDQISTFLEAAGNDQQNKGVSDIR